MHWRLDVVGIKQLPQQALAIKLRRLAEVLAVAPKQIESIIFQPILAACRQLCLQLGKIGSALADHHHFAIDDRVTRDI